jgi:hypothetical protein
MLFTVTRSGGSDGAVSASWSVSLTGNAAADDLGTPLSGTVSFAAGQTSATIRVPVRGDLVAEPNETFSVLLSAPTGGATIADGTARHHPQRRRAAGRQRLHQRDQLRSGRHRHRRVHRGRGLAGTDLSGWTLVLYNGNGGALTPP